MLREVAGLRNGRQADGEPHGDRRLVIAGGWLEVPVEMASVIDVGTVLLRRPRVGMGVTRSTRSRNMYEGWQNDRSRSETRNALNRT